MQIKTEIQKSNEKVARLREELYKAINENNDLKIKDWWYDNKDKI